MPSCPKSLSPLAGAASFSNPSILFTHFDAPRRSTYVQLSSQLAVAAALDEHALVHAQADKVQRLLYGCHDGEKRLLGGSRL